MIRTILREFLVPVVLSLVRNSEVTQHIVPVQE